MGMGDPFGTTYEGAYKGANFIGQGIESAATAVGGSMTDIAKMKYQQAQNDKMLQMIGLGQKNGMVDSEEPSNDELAKTIEDFGKQKGQNITINHGDNPEQAKDNMMGIIKALGIPMPQPKHTINADFKPTVTMEDGKVKVSYKDTTPSPEVEAMREQTQEDRRTRLKDQESNRLDIEFDKLDKIANPDIATNRSPLGMAGRANMAANRALTTLDNPMVTNQEAGNVMADVASIYQNGSPTEFGMSEQGYKTLYAQAQSALQYFTGKPQDALTPEIKDRLKGVLSGMKDTNKGVIKENLDALESLHKTTISKDPDRWKEYRSKIESMGGYNDSVKSNSVKSTLKAAGMPPQQTQEKQVPKGTPINKVVAQRILEQAGGDPEKARTIARILGYQL